MLQLLVRFPPSLPFLTKFERSFTSNVLLETSSKLKNYQYGRTNGPSLVFSANSFSTSESIDYSSGKLITTHVSSIRFDKIIRKGLNISQLDFEKAFYDQLFRLNNEVLLKKSQKVKQYDILDLVIREVDGKIFGKRTVLVNTEEKSNGFIMYSSCQKIWSRPPIFLFLCVLVLCVALLTGSLIKFQAADSIPDPDVKTNSAKMLHTFSELEFCSEPWTSSTRQFQLTDAFLLNLDSSKSDVVFSRNVRLGIIYTYKPVSSKSKPLFAQMRGSHLGFTGSDAFEKINVSLLVPDFDPNDPPCNGKHCVKHSFDSCLSLAAPTKLFPHFHDHEPCTAKQLEYLRANSSARLMWQKKFHLVDRQRCRGHITWEPKLYGETPLMPTLSTEEIWLISVRLMYIIGFLLILILTICLALMCKSSPGQGYRELRATTTTTTPTRCRPADRHHQPKASPKH
ncbi:unnamed protein product [Rodentolepis nana]|uniref:TMEM219 domain-containing protein n=1 Tax=Rodentolepis nana TaxID=102285 RepID=A0A0R3TCU8_RODNA|nr:unnamed protein product [Rodentolepis nana]